ncbi:tRNA (adenosine(37)-N6)-threonylcarbamoyltransferase complex transferase subunit TsaD [Granulibacter bethesdensis]|uniref:tRNA (adenosine(37)-N6)-threonylcarbamoyltransferase complex transferase subunit TsaD n=1 Tax=Granulibacter bethesdensis TaxID=364410 RepID=UPI0000E0D464|nr:tRNA (adenosine(37)-N6)-threonylcarbamoyltransferase complex transferase subunit TsaD [Granulibacter bethesdensis]ABI63323.1 O-sialoglycoprotein endopeptidase [Granulibacter bethesdensis CGDNIH1]APH53209.1 O-sialoglycoprotein endopeptidase [Granulibacter bethesdensis]APH65897.1 O-sialoglycoprotein endopeptidase [Granulibacter bethesdensis]
MTPNLPETHEAVDFPASENLFPGPVLGIETSCDETAAAVLDGSGRILAEIVLSQYDDHARFGGVVPEIAARAHLAYLPGMVTEVMDKAGLRFQDLAAIAATSGPGLIGGLLVGAGLGKGLALAAKRPFIAINHLEAHALAALLPALGGVAEITSGEHFPFLLMLLSGGHCQCILVEGVGRYRRLGGTIDDAVGEAFDKVGKLLGLGWPGGPALERLALQGNPHALAFPRPMKGRVGCDFSFSGLKTAVAQYVARFPDGPLPLSDAADIAASFQAAVADVMADRATAALAMADEIAPAKMLVVSGGVAANAAIRAALSTAAEHRGIAMLAPPPRLCTDNAVMVAWAGLHRLKYGAVSGLDHAPLPRWPLDAPDMALPESTTP